AIEPVNVEREDVNLEQRMDRALSTRPELQAARRSLESRQLSERVAKIQTRPEVNIVGSVNPYGNNFELSDTNGDGTPDLDRRARGQSLSEVPGFDNYFWTLGAQFRYQ